MRHKILSFFICLLTSTILLAHAAVPHHHGEEHSTHHSHHNHDSDGGLKGIFSMHCHSSDCFTVVTRHSKTERSEYKHICDTALLQDIPFSGNGDFLQPKHYTSFNYTHSSFHLINIDFRGPPAFSV